MKVLRRPRPSSRPASHGAHASPLLVWLALGAVYVIWGSTYLAIRYAIRTIPPFLMGSIRFLIAGAVLYAWAIRRGDREGDRPTWRQWRAATIAGGLLLLGGNGGVVWAEQKVPIGIVAIVIAMVPIWMALMDRLFFGQRLPGWAVVGLVLGFGGLVLLIGGPGHGQLNAAGLAAAVGASLTWSAGSLYARRAPLPRRQLVGTGMEMLAGGALLGLAALAAGEFAKFHPTAISAQSLWATAYLVVFGSWIGFASYVWLLRVAPTSLVSTYAYVNPVIAVFLGWAFLDEALKARTLVAAAIIVVGVALIISARKIAPGDPADAISDGIGSKSPLRRSMRG
jgi:drug/metabolite transporter (DMT)-like permease